MIEKFCLLKKNLNENRHTLILRYEVDETESANSNASEHIQIQAVNFKVLIIISTRFN